jgi:hypothetical protein
MELLKKIVLKLSRGAVFGNSIQPVNPQASKKTELAAAALKVKLQYLAIRDPNYDIGTALPTASKGRADTVLMMTSRISVLQRTQITDLAAKSRIPAIAARIRHHPIGTQEEIWTQGRAVIPPLSRHLPDD